jgi:hypothetical protein
MDSAKSDDVTDLVDEQRVTGNLECLRAMRLYVESVPNPSDRRLREASLVAIGRVQEPFDTVCQKALTPLPDRVLMDAEFTRKGFAGKPSAHRRVTRQRSDKDLATR